jgi:hypothetical protein
MRSNRSSIYGRDEPGKEGKHVTYDDPEWMAMLANARAFVSGYRDDPCAEVERNLSEMERENELARRRRRSRETLEQGWAESRASQAVSSPARPASAPRLV